MLASLAYLTALLACMARVSSSFASPLVTRENDSVGGYASNPQPPPLKFLYEMYAEVAPPLAIPNGPKGDRLVFPIVGGTFEGPIVKGKVINLGADWGLAVGTDRFYPDTRYGLVTENGENIYIQTRGAYQPDRTAHLAAFFETSLDGDYAWMNDVTGYGLIEDVTASLNTTLSKPKLDAKNTILRIRMWHYVQGVLPNPSP